MNGISHLDCSLRDGGYYNNWDFPESLINQYLQVLDCLNIDFCEIGFRYLSNKGFKGSCAFSSEEFLDALIIPEKLNIAVMINGKELIDGGVFIIEHLKKLIPVNSNLSKVDMVRIACPSDSIKIILPAFKYLHDEGYLTACNVTQISDKSPLTLEEIAKLISSSSVDVLYFADSLGSLIPTDLNLIVNSFRKYWSGPLGIHAHDNKSLALSNTMEAIKLGVNWVDSTITGIGRGPGNAKTEELIIELNKNNKKTLNLVPLIKLINKEFIPLKNIYMWGTNLFYYLAGEYSIHPSYIQSMLSDYRYKEEDILAAINYLKEKDGKKFNFNELDDTRKFYNSFPKGSWSPRTIFDGRDVLIVGTGKQLKNHEKAIHSFIKRVKPIVLAINTQTLEKNELIDLRIACHPTRLLADMKTHLTLNEPLVTPLSMLPNEFVEIFKDKNILDYGIGLSDGDFQCLEKFCLIPNCLVISYSLAVVTSGNSKNIYLAGFDGYSYGDSRNDEVNDLFFKFKKSHPESNLIAITPTKYKNLLTTSVYGI